MLEWVHKAVMKMTIGENIKTVRKQKGLTQKQLAERTGLATITIQQYEADKYEPRPDNIIRIAKVLEVAPYEIGGSLLWDELSDLETLQKESKVFELIISLYGQETASTINDFLSLDPEGQEKASDYIDFLMQKHRKE